MEKLYKNQVVENGIENVCENLPKHKIALKKCIRSSKMRSETLLTHQQLKKQFRLVCVFPEKTPDEETVKSDVKKILSAELKQQMQR